MAERTDFSRLDSLLGTALDHPPAQRTRWLAEACGNDVALRERLEKLIALAEGGEAVFPAGGGLQGAIWEDIAREIGSAEPGLQPGERLGRYEVKALLGVGGMGRVYQAFDPVLGRQVAIKALSEAIRGDVPDLRRRLEREARLLATLSHPSIAAIHGFELIDGAPYLVLELVEGQTLAERLRRGALPLQQAVGVALQVAEALEEAHRKGVVHRDLKPSNIKLSPDGRVKVLDFGIAKPLAREDDEKTPEAILTMTQTGAILGTAPYMSPEQVRGEPVDTRTDIWAFGCLLHEMLTGQPAFQGASSAEVMATVLRDDVDWSRLPPETPPALRRLLRRCLRRELRERIQDIGDARIELSELGREEPDGPGPPSPSRRPRAGWPWLLGAAVLSLLVGAWIGSRRERAAAPSVASLSLELPAGLSIADDYAAPFAISPDGSRLSVLATQAGTSSLYRRDVASVEATPIQGTEGAWQPSFSPDGRDLVFFAERKLKRVSLEGGPALTLAEVEGNPRGASWGSDGTIVLAPGQYMGLVRLNAGGGPLEPVTRLDLARGEGSHRWPQILPGGRWVLFTVGIEDASYDDARVEVVSLETGERRRVLDGAAHARYAGGRIFYANAGRLLAVPFDLQELAIRGAPDVVREGIRYDPRNGATHFALSESGTLVYGPAAPSSPDKYVVWVDAAGGMERIGTTPRPFSEPSLAPDGRRIAVRIGTEAECDLWILEAGSAALSRLSFGLSPHRPTWTPDGRGITVGAGKEGTWKLLTLSTTGATAPAVLREGPYRMYPNAWTPDGRFLIFQERGPANGWDLRVLEVARDGRPAGPVRDLVATRAQERNAALSRDGLNVAYESDERDAVTELYVMPFGRPGEKTRVTAAFARWPRWGAGDQLYCWYPFGARPRARPLDSPLAQGLHRIDWRQTMARREPVPSAPLWGSATPVPALLNRLVVGSYAGFDADVSGPHARFLFLETSAASLDKSLQRPVVVLDWLDDVRDRAARRR